MVRFRRFFFLFSSFWLGLWILPAWAATPPKTHCQQVSDGVSWGYCISKPARAGNPDVLYYFHGATRNEANWSQARLSFYSEWEKQGLPAPTVVAVSFGRIWVLAEKTSNSRGGLLEHFMEKSLPRIEKELGGVRGRRLLMGESMGGFNVSQLVLKHPSYWDRAAILCPAFLTFSPFAGSGAQRDYIQRTGASWLHVQGAVSMFQSYFADDGAWKRSSPVELARGRLDPLTPRVLVACGSRDEFGFFEGAKSFAESTVAQFPETQWHPTNGRHCSFPLKQVAEFIAR